MDDPGATFRGMLHCIGRDVHLVHRHTLANPGRLSLLRWIDVASMPGIQCAIIHRVAHWLHARGLRWVAGVVAGINRIVHKADITPASRIGPGLYAPHVVGLVFHASAGARLILLSRTVVCGSGIHADRSRLHGDSPILGDDVVVGTNAAVLGQITIGSGSMISGNVVVTVDVPENAVLIDRRMRRTVTATPVETTS